MSDDGEKKRPNANYRLSRENANPDDIVYHYNRERRLAKAPQAVRDLYNDKPKKRFGLFGPLVDTKPKLIMFGSIVVACIMIIAISFLGLFGDTYNFDGNRLTVQAIRYEGTIIMALKKTVRKDALARLGNPYTGAVDIAVAPPAKADQPPQDIFYHRIFFTAEQEELYRFAVPFNSEELLMVFQTETKTLDVRVRPE
ncbi:MAG: hypothetical protein LBQ69_05950 [Treponema sp.]|jgi:hypothetical protein|nr:hypothetical protein [Treponema sp.]